MDVLAYVVVQGTFFVLDKRIIAKPSAVHDWVYLLAEHCLSSRWLVELGEVPRRGHLTDRQLAILHRVAVGDDLADALNGDKRSATALHDRGLVVVRRSPWRAAITDTVRYYLEHGGYPANMPRRTAAQAQRQPAAKAEAGSRPGASSSPVRSKRKRPPPHTTARISAERRTAVEELIDELLDISEKVIKNADDETQTHWRQVIDFVKRNQLVPSGKRIEKSRNGWSELRIRLVSGPHPNSRRDPACRSCPCLRSCAISIPS